MGIAPQDPRWKVAAGGGDSVISAFESWLGRVWAAVEKKAKMGFTPKEVKDYDPDVLGPLEYQLAINYKTGDPQEYSMLQVSLAGGELHLSAIVLTDGGNRDSVASKKVPLTTSSSDVANRLMEMLAGEFQKLGH